MRPSVTEDDIAALEAALLASTPPDPGACVQLEAAMGEVERALEAGDGARVEAAFDAAVALAQGRASSRQPL